MWTSAIDQITIIVTQCHNYYVIDILLSYAIHVYHPPPNLNNSNHCLATYLCAKSNSNLMIILCYWEHNFIKFET